MEQVERFPRWRLWRRLYTSTEAALGRVPMLVLIPTAGAIIGAAWGVSHQSEVIRRGLIVGRASFAHVLITALIGGVLGILVLIGFVFVGAFAWYRLLGRNKLWEVVFLLNIGGPDVPRVQV